MYKPIEKFIPPPVKGLNTREILTPGVSEYALQLDMLIPRSEGLTLPHGMSAPITNPAMTDNLVTLFNYNGTQLFGAGYNGIYALPGTVSGIAITEPVGYAVNISTAAGSYCIFFNGFETPKIYDGTSWAAVAWIGPTLASLFQGIVYRRRLYMADKANNRFWYLPVDAVTGTATQFNLGTVFTKGGNLVAMATLSLDGGLGPDDLLIAYSSNGEMAVFAGNDPGASDWSIIGVYDVGLAACGTYFQPKIFTKIGGDLYVLTTLGVLSVTQIIRGKEVAAIPSLSANIDSYMLPWMRASMSTRVTMSVIRSEKLLVINMSRSGIKVADTYAMDLSTGGWCRFPMEDVDDSYGYCWDYQEIIDNGQTKVYALGGLIGEPKRVFNADEEVASGTANPWVIRTPYMRLGSLNPNEPINFKPYIWMDGSPGSGNVYTYQAGVAVDLSDVYNLQDAGGTTQAEGGWAKGGGFYLDTEPGVFGRVSRPWITVAANAGGNVSLYLKGTFTTGAAATPDEFKYLGTDFRTGTLGVVGT